MESEREKGLPDKDRRDPNVHGFSEVSPPPTNAPDLNQDLEKRHGQSVLVTKMCRYLKLEGSRKEMKYDNVNADSEKEGMLGNFAQERQEAAISGRPCRRNRRG